MEPKRKVTDLDKHQVIHCPTEADAIAICNLMQEHGWDKICANPSVWLVNKALTYFRPKTGTYGNILSPEVKGSNIYPASDFLTPKEETVKRLPKYWVVEIPSGDTTEFKGSVVAYMNSLCDIKTWAGRGVRYYGFDGNEFENGTAAKTKLSYFQNNPTLLTLSEFKETEEYKEFLLSQKETKQEPAQERNFDTLAVGNIYLNRDGEEVTVNSFCVHFEGDNQPFYCSDDLYHTAKGFTYSREQDKPSPTDLVKLLYVKEGELKPLLPEPTKEKEALTFPRLMLVWDLDQEDKRIREVFAHEPRLSNPYFTIMPKTGIGYSTEQFRCAEEIPAPTELTPEEAVVRLNEGTKPEPGQTFTIKTNS